MRIPLRFVFEVKLGKAAVILGRISFNYKGYRWDYGVQTEVEFAFYTPIHKVGRPNDSISNSTANNGLSNPSFLT